MDEKQVDVVESEGLQRLVEGTPRLARLMEAVVELTRDVDVAPVEPGRANGLADPVLIAVHLRGVDVAIADLERVHHRLRRLGRRNLEHAESELRNRMPVVQRDRGYRCHAAILPEPPSVGGGRLD